MNTILNILTLLLISTLFSCGQQNGKKKIPADSTVNLQTRIDKKEKERLEKRKALEEQASADSLRLDQVLQRALKMAEQQINKDKFIKKYEVSQDGDPMSVEINLDYHFTKTSPHLIIRRSDRSAVYIDIYTKGGNKFEKVVSHEQWTMTYVNDTIQDINGDGLNDFVVSWYGSSGCCLKAFSNVYLLRQDQKGFSENFEFINPTFSPKEKIIRGVCYGHPGQTEMYKYRWNGEKIDTLEYVSYEKNDKGEKTGKILISNKEPYGEQFKIMKRLNNVPSEYTKINGYDWFTGSL
jgi:urease beta subunit